MGCGSSKSQAQEAQNDRKRIKIADGSQPVNSPARSIGGKPGPKKIGGNFEARSYTDERDMENEHFQKSLKDNEAFDRQMMEQEQAKIVSQTEKSMFDLSQLEPLDPREVEARSKLYEQSYIEMRDPVTTQFSIKLPGTKITDSDVDALLQKPVADRDNELATKFAHSLVDVFKAMNVKPSGDLVESFALSMKRD